MQSIRNSLFFFVLKNWETSIALRGKDFCAVWVSITAEYQELSVLYSVELENFNCLARDRFFVLFWVTVFNVYSMRTVLHIVQFLNPLDSWERLSVFCRQLAYYCTFFVPIQFLCFLGKKKVRHGRLPL